MAKNDHFGHDPFYQQMVMVKWSKLTDISEISTNFTSKFIKILGL
jgi:hypothetical protein